MTAVPVSIVHYQFKSAKEVDNVYFEGPVLSVLDLKTAIVKKHRLLESQGDFDLVLSNIQTGEEYFDDRQFIPKNTSLLVRRVAGNRNRSLRLRIVEAQKNPQPLTTASGVPTSRLLNPDGTLPANYGSSTAAAGASGAAGESGDASGANSTDADDPLNQLFEEQAKELAAKAMGRRPRPPGPGDAAGAGVVSAPQGQFVPPGAQGGAPAGQSHPGQHGGFRPPPEDYTCRKCNTKGHWIQQCPMPSQGPSRAMLSSMPRSLTNQTATALLNASDELTQRIGQLGHAPPPAATAGVSNERQMDASRPSVLRIFVPGTDAMDFPEIPPGFRCPYCLFIMRQPSSMTCCGSLGCDECLRRHLQPGANVESTSKCPGCMGPATFANVVPQERMRSAINTWLQSLSSNQVLRARNAMQAAEQAPPQHAAMAAAASLLGIQWIPGTAPPMLPGASQQGQPGLAQPQPQSQPQSQHQSYSHGYSHDRPRYQDNRDRGAYVPRQQHYRQDQYQQPMPLQQPPYQQPPGHNPTHAYPPPHTMPHGKPEVQTYPPMPPQPYNQAPYPPPPALGDRRPHDQSYRDDRDRDGQYKRVR